MKINLKRISKSTLAVILAIMTMVSTMLIGTFTANAASIQYWSLCYQGNSWADDDDNLRTSGVNGTITFDNSSTNYSTFYFRVVAHQDDGNYYHNNVNNTTTSVTSGSENTLYWNCYTANSIAFSPTKRYITISIRSDGTSNYVTVTESDTDPGSSSDPGEISADLLSVLKGEKVMFYYGDIWGEGTKYLRTSTSTSSNIASGTATKYSSLTINNQQNATYYACSVAAAPAQYYISNSSTWDGVQMQNSAAAGRAYVLNSYETIGGGTNNVYTFSGGTVSVATTADASIATGEKLSVSSGTPGSSVVGKSNTIKYYITSDNATFTEYTLSNGSLDTSALSAGTYTLKTVLYDGNIYVVGDTDTFTVSAEATYTVAYATATGIASAPANASVSAGSEVTISGYTASTGYEITGYTVTKTGDTSTTVAVTDNKFTMPAYNVTVTPTVKASTTPQKTYYITGRFRIKDSAGNETKIGWINAGTGQTSDIKFSYDSTKGLYYLDTGCTIAELSAQITQGGTAEQYFFISDGSNTYSAKDQDMENHTASSPLTLNETTSNADSMLFSDTTNTSGPVTLWLDVSSGYKLYYTVPSVDPVDVTPTFKDGKTVDSKTVATGKTLNLDVTATLAGVTDDYTLIYSTVCSDNINVTITGANTATPAFVASAPGTYTVTTTVTNYANTDLTATRTTTVTVSDTVVSNYKVVLYNSTKIDMTEVKDGLYVSTATVESDTDTTKYFTIFNTADSKYAKGTSTDHHWINDANTTAPVSSWVSEYPTTGNYLNKYNSAKYVVYDSSSAEIYLVDDLDLTSSKVYAKKGSYGASTVVDTTVDGITFSSSDDTNDCNIYSASLGSTVKLTSTIKDAYKDTYFVYAYVINGKDYVLATQDPLDSTKYTAEFTVTKEATNYEVTPIYYVNDCKDSSKNYITFYVDAAELGDAWGNTIACYSYYYTEPGSTSTESLMADGSYPGQPMLYDKEQNLYFARLPKTMSGTIDSTAYTNIPVTGITINNFKNDAIHSKLNSLSNNAQSYDFNDFRYINELGMDMAVFDIKLRKHDDGANNKDISETSFNYNTFANINGWDKFTDFDGNDTDILGGELDASNTNKLYIVSRGDYEDTNTVGQYATRWYVYNQSGALVTYGNPSDFIPRLETEDEQGNKVNHDTDQITAIKNGGYVGAAVEITYESQKGTDTTRLDGRWYYTSMDTDVTANVRYQLENSDGNWGDILEDVDIASINGATSATFKRSSVSATIIANSTNAGSNYIFDCWGLLNDDGTVTTTDNTSPSMTINQLAKDTTYVAMFRQADEGTLYLSHTSYPGGGLGYYYITATLNGTTYKGTTSGSGQNLSIPVTENDGDITIILTTTTVGDNTFENWYQASAAEPFIIGDTENGIITVNGTALADGEEIPANTSGTLSYQFTISTSKLFDSNNGLLITSFDWYSKVSSVSKNCVLTYKYIDRYGNEKSYVKPVELDATYYAANGNSWLPNDELISQYAPAIDDLYKDCTWVIANSVKNGSEVTLEATQSTKYHDVTIDIGDGVETPINGVSDNSYLYENSAEKTFYVAQNVDNFSYWLVQVKSEDGTLREVAKCYSTEFNLRIVDDYIITAKYGETIENSVTIAEPVYSHEVYTDANGKEYDYLYADFLVAYMTADGNVSLKDNSNYKTGIILEVDTTDVLSDDEKSTGFNPSAHEKTDMSNDQLKTVATTISNNRYLKVDGSTTYLYNYIIDNSKYNNYNRLDYIVKFANTEGWQNRVIKAYYYVYDISADTLTVSDPVYFNLYEFAQKEAAVNQ